jgi:hypothetical protein
MQGRGQAVRALSHACRLCPATASPAAAAATTLFRKGGASIVWGNDRQEGDMNSLVNALRASILLFLLLATIGGGTASSADAQVPSKAAFGDKLTFQSSAASYDVSSDKQAFTMTVNPAIEVSAGNPPVATQAFSAVIPASGRNIDASFAVSAFVRVDEGASATMIIAANDTSTVKRFPSGTNQSVEVVHRYRAGAASDIRLTIFLLAERDQAHPDAAAGIHADNIDGDLGQPKKRGKN